MDQSGNGNDALQTTDAKKPVWYALDPGLFNNYPVLLFDNTDDWLATAAFSSALTQPTSIFAVGNWTTYNNYPMIFSGIPGGNTHNVFALDITGVLYMFAGLDIGSSTSPTFNPVLISTLFNGVSSEMWLNGGSILTGNAGAQTLTGLTIGARYDAGASFFGGNIVAIVGYNPGLSNADRQTVENGLNARYSIW